MTTSTRTESTTSPHHVKATSLEGNDNATLQVKVMHVRKEILGWMTDTYEIDSYKEDYCKPSVPAAAVQCSSLPGSTSSSSMSSSTSATPTSGADHKDLVPLNPHTVLMFVPGNPGCAAWYIPMLKSVIECLGEGYAARAVNYAGHGTEPDVVVQTSPNADVGTKEKMRKDKVAWTIDGQVLHKIHWCNDVMKELMERRKHSLTGVSPSHPPKIVWISHSIGSHLVQRQLVLCKNILLQTQAVIHLMPFIRFDPIPKWKKIYLSSAANTPYMTAAILQACSSFSKTLPQSLVDFYLERIAGISLLEDRELARGLLCNPDYAKNFIMLGMEEIRDVPEKHDLAALKMIGNTCPIFMLYCGGPDQWAPKNHMDDLSHLYDDRNDASFQCGKILTLEYMHDLIHSFIVYPHMVKPVVKFICKSILKSCEHLPHGTDPTVCNVGIKSKL